MADIDELIIDRLRNIRAFIREWRRTTSQHFDSQLRIASMRRGSPETIFLMLLRGEITLQELRFDQLCLLDKFNRDMIRLLRSAVRFQLRQQIIFSDPQLRRYIGTRLSWTNNIILISLTSHEIDIMNIYLENFVLQQGFYG